MRTPIIGSLPPETESGRTIAPSGVGVNDRDFGLDGGVEGRIMSQIQAVAVFWTSASVKVRAKAPNGAGGTNLAGLV